MIDWGDVRALDPPTRGQDLNSRSILQLLGVRQAQGSTGCHWRHPLGQQHSYLLCSQETELRDLLQLHDVYELIGLQEACGESTVVNMTVESPLGLHIDKLLFEEISKFIGDWRDLPNNFIYFQMCITRLRQTFEFAGS